MNKFSIPAFVENLVPDTANTKYSRGKLKIYYVGETVDKRLFTKDFSDKLLATAAYTPVVGFYSIADEDFIGHNNVQHIYGLIPAEAELSYVEDAEAGVTFAVTDIILYTGRPDETGVIASKIIGKQHSLELNPDTVKYKINRDEAGNFKNLEFTEGELIGLSVLGENDTPAFSGSEFFSAVELPDFITEENKDKYEALFNAMFSVEPTAEEVVTEIYRTMESQRIYGYIREHKPEQYVVLSDGYGAYRRYNLSRNEDESLKLTFDCDVRERYISDEEIIVLTNAKKGSADDATAQNNFVTGTETTPGDNSATLTDGGTEQPVEQTNTQNDSGTNADTNPEFEALRSNCERLERENSELSSARTEIENTLAQERANYQTSLNICLDGIMQGYRCLLSEDKMSYYETNYKSMSPDELISALVADYEAQKQSAISDIVEITAIESSFTNYDENDEEAVVQKYLKMNRGKN